MTDYIGLVAGDGTHQLLSIEQIGRDIIVASTSECIGAISLLVKGDHEIPAKDATIRAVVMLAMRVGGKVYEGS